MPKYQIVHYFTTAKTYVVEAKDEDHALELVNGSPGVDPDTVGGPEFCDETVEELEK